MALFLPQQSKTFVKKTKRNKNSLITWKTREIQECPGTNVSIFATTDKKGYPSTIYAGYIRYWQGIFYLSYYLLKKIIAGKGVENNHD